MAINVPNQPFVDAADAPNGEYLDETRGLDEAARKKITPPAPVLNASTFRIYRKIH